MPDHVLRSFPGHMKGQESQCPENVDEENKANQNDACACYMTVV